MKITLSFGRLICLLFELFATKYHDFVISKPITTVIFLYTLTGIDEVDVKLDGATKQFKTKKQ